MRNSPIFFSPIVIEDQALGPIDAGFLSAVGIVLALSGDSTAAELDPSALPMIAGQARTRSSMFLGCRVTRVSGDLDLLVERHDEILLVSSVMKLRRGDCPKSGDLTEFIFILAQELCSHREVL